MRSLVGILIGVLASWAGDVLAEPAYLYFNYEREVVQGSSTYDVCERIYPYELDFVYPNYAPWVNGRFEGYGSPSGRYAFQWWSFSCAADGRTGTISGAYIGHVWCDTNSSGDNPNLWWVDYQRERCVCDPRPAYGNYVTENGKCVTQSASRCTFTLDNVCHGGKNNGPSCPSSGNPINPGNGNKFLLEAIYRGQNGFELTLAYNTQDEETARFGRRWRDAFDRRIAIVGTMAVAFRPDGRGLRFVSGGGAWIADADTADRLTELQDPPGTRTGWQLYVGNGDELETYDASGKLLSIRSRSGLTQTLLYSDGTSGSIGGFFLDANGQQTAYVLPAGKLIRATDSFGRVLAFGYGLAANVAAVTDPAGGIFRFAYDTSNRLISITFPDNKVRTYLYNEPDNTGGTIQTYALTGVIDENGDRYATYKYDAQGRAISTEHAGGTLRYTLAYNADGSTAVTNPLGAVSTYGFQNILGAIKSTMITGAACSYCGAPTQTYDINGNVASRTDWNGNRANYAYDLARNLETSRIEGLMSGGGTTPQTRTITTEWHTTYRLPARIAEPLRITTNVYGDPADTNPGNRGSLLSRTIRATTDTNGATGFGATPIGTPRTWSYTYNGNGQVLTADGPRTDVSDITTYTYYPNDATCPGASALGCRGQIETITNAAGHVTQITEYNAHSQPLIIVDPNGLVTTLTYELRMRLTSRNVGGEISTYDYDGVGQLTKVTLPDGSFLGYTYDTAHRLTEIRDSLGNRIAYTLDAMGNRTQEQVFDPANQLKQARSREYNNLNRLIKDIGGTNPATQITQYGYDNQGNLTSVDGPLDNAVSNDVRTYTYDALNRLATAVDPSGAVGGTTTYGYTGLDQLASVTDPRNLVTSYSYDGLGNLNQQLSPDTGNMVNTYDAAGNLLTSTDAKGQVTSYTYDALNRVSTITYHGGVVDTYQYDQGVNGKGRLTQVTEPNSTTQYAYDQKGRLTSETRTINGVAYTTGYSYDSAGRMIGITYPSGRTVSYTLDSQGRVSEIATAKDSATLPVVTSVAYRPFGPTQGFTFGNGQTYTRGFDLDGRVASYTLANQSVAVHQDEANRIFKLAASGEPERNYAYDSLARLTSFIYGSTNQSFYYDAVGNRTTKVVGAATDTYSYPGTSNRLSAITGANNRSYSYDLNGSITGDSLNSFTYDPRGRLSQATSALGTTTYQVNSLGQRIRKTNVQGDTVYHYDAQGRLIAETSASGQTQKEYIYLGDTPVAVIQ